MPEFSKPVFSFVSPIRYFLIVDRMDISCEVHPVSGDQGEGREDDPEEEGVGHLMFGVSV